MNDDGAFPTFARIPRIPSALWWAGKTILAHLWRAVKWLWRRTWRWLAGFVVLVLLVHTIASIVTGRELERELGKLRAAGDPLALVEAAPKPVPPDRNAAVVYQRAFEYLPRDEDWVQVSEALTIFPERRAKISWPKVERVVSQSSRAIALLEQASRMPECRFPVNWEAGFAATFPHLGKFREAVRLLAVKAELEARRGRTREAMSAIGTALRMSDHIAMEPTPIAELARHLCQGMALNALNRTMDIHPPDAAESERMFNLLSRIDTIGPFIHGMKGERAIGLSAFDFARSHPLPFWLLPGPSTYSAYPERGPTWTERLVSFLWRPVFNKDEVFYLRSFAKAISASRLPYRQARASIPRPQTGKTGLITTPAPKYAVITQMVLPVFDYALAARDKALAKLSLARWGLAINVFQIREGRCPKSLDEVRQTVAWKLPVDPFSGKDFIYRLEPLAQAQAGPRGYVLYSIGPNLRDDGGRFLPSSEYPRLGPERPDDIAWRVQRAPGTGD
jgi:hypothetical protein